MMKFVILIVLILGFGCSNEKVDNDENNEFISALFYHHDFKVSGIIERYAENGEIERKMVTERVAVRENFWTPLCFAAISGNRKAVELLISFKANVNYHDGNLQTPFILAAIAGSVEIMQVLLENGADINARDIDGNTALIYAVSNGNSESVRFLVENGCDLESVHSNGHTALDFAIFYHETRIINYLEKKGLKRHNPM